MIKIAYILTPIEFGGLERVCLDYLKNADRNHFDIFPVLLIRPWERETIVENKLKELNYPIYKIPVSIKPPGHGRDIFRIIRCIRLLSDFIRYRYVDLIHTHGYLADTIGIIVAKLFKVSAISTCHGFIRNTRKYRLYNKIDLIALKRFDRIITVSEDIYKELLISGFQSKKLITIENAVDDNAYSQNQSLLIETKKIMRLSLGVKSNDIVIGYVGRLSVEKGIKNIIITCKIMANEGYPIRVIIVGDGPIRKELEEMTIKMNIKNLIKFVGFQKDVMPWFCAMDIFVLPSLTEGTPISLLEAMNLGLPSIATEVGGVPNVIESGVDGILINGSQVDLIKNAILNLVNNEKIRTNMGKKAKEKIARKYNIKKWVSKIENEYLELTVTDRPNGATQDRLEMPTEK